MQIRLLKSFGLSAIAVIGYGQSAIAVPELDINQSIIGNVTSVSQLSDVRPTDWSFQALQSLVERYGCLTGYPDQTFRGNREIGRFEFAAGLNACLERVNEPIGQETQNIANQADLATIEKLQQDFATELVTLKGKVDRLEPKVEKLENTQFSTTAKLSGDAIFQVADTFGGDARSNNETVFQQRINLALTSSFTGRDRLQVRFQAGNFQDLRQPGNELRFGYATGTNNAVRLGVLNYQFPIGDRTTAIIYANNDTLQELTTFNPINPFSAPAGRGAISRFAAAPPIYRTANTNAGIGVNVNLTKQLSFGVGYLAGEPANASPGAGLFSGNYGTIGRLLAQDLFGSLDIALVYVHSYTGTTLTSSGLPWLVGSRSASVAVGRPIVANSYGIGTNLNLSPKVQIGGWANFSAVRAIGLGDADVWNYGVGLAVSDLGGKGNLAGLIVGMQPRLTNATPALSNALGKSKDPDVGMHVEAFYRVKINDYMDITPGVVWLTAPDHNSANDAIVIGAFRTNVRF